MLIYIYIHLYNVFIWFAKYASSFFWNIHILNGDFTGNLGGLFGQLISGDNLVVPSGYD